MSFHIKAEQERFKWQLSDGYPIAEVERWGNGYWVVCCPLCSYIHNLPANIKVDTTGTPWKPNCAIAKKCHSHMYHAWQQKYPRAWEFDTIRAVLRLPNVLPLSVPPTPVKQPYIAAEKAA